MAIQSNPWNARTYFMNDLVDQVVRAILLFASAGCFRRVADSSGEQPLPASWTCGSLPGPVISATGSP